MTEEELSSQPGAVATRAEDESDTSAAEQVFSPLDFRLNLGARLADRPAEPLPNLDNPAIRKLTWEHVVSDRPASSAPSAATTVPLPPPSRVLPPPPPRLAMPFQPPVEMPVPGPTVERHATEEDVVEEDLLEEVAIENDDCDDVVESALPVVEPEINRLASVPDLIDDDSPIELPLITPSAAIVAHVPSVYTPVLAETQYVTPLRPITTTVAVSAVDDTTSRRRASRKPERHLFRTFLTLVSLFGLLAGGAFAAKKYLLHQPTWSVELKPLADDVAAARGLQFKLAVEVIELPIGDYAKRLAGSTVDPQADRAPTWRALGLLNGDLDLEAIGRQALNDSPAFYDPATKTILVTDDLKTHEHLYRFALHRALAAALLDQQFDWSSRVATASPAAALGIKAIIDGDALAVANSLAANDAPDHLAPELFAFVQGHGNTLAPSQYAATIAGRAGVSMRPTITSMVNDPVALAALEQATPSSDAALDAARTEVATSSPAGTQGMMFWYYVLASRIDDSQAWSAAVRWTGDSLSTSTGSASKCVDAKVAAADADGAAVLLGAFESWAATASVESTTTVVPIDGNQVAIRACDPGAALTAQLPVKVPVVFGGAGVERALVQAAVSAAGDTKVDAACLVNAARQRGTGLSSPSDDAPVLAVTWESAYVVANLDLATGCVAATG